MLLSFDSASWGVIYFTILHLPLYGAWVLANGSRGGGGMQEFWKGAVAGLSNINNNEGEGGVVQKLLETRTWWHWF